MRIITEKQIKKFQEGGAMPAEAPMAAEATPVEGAAAQQDPIAMLAEMSVQALQSQDCQLAMQVCEGFVSLIQQMQGGAPAQEPVFRKGGKMLRKKACRK